MIDKKPKPNRRITYVLDTNVLLTNSKVLSSLRDADVVLSTIVISELDKVKMNRGDADLRFRGREISRFLFDLSEKGDLMKGVALGANSTLRVSSFEPGNDLPIQLKNKTADDLIVGLALTLSNTGSGPVVLMTNDLNMLIKAQSLGLTVERSSENGGNRFLAKFTKKWQIQVLPVVVVFLLGIIAFFMYTLVDRVQTASQEPQQTTESSDQAAIRKYNAELNGTSSDFKPLVSLGNIYQRRREWSQAALYYGKAVLLNPRDMPVRTNLAIAYFNSGRQLLAIQVLNQIVTDDWSYAPAHYNLGAMYYTLAQVSQEAKRDADTAAFLKRAQSELNLYIRLDPKGASIQSAKNQLRDIKRLIAG